MLEIPRSSSGSNIRVSSHVLCTHGNEIFMHCLNYSPKSYLEDRPSIDSLGDKLKEYRSSVLTFLFYSSCNLDYTDY